MGCCLFFAKCNSVDESFFCRFQINRNVKYLHPSSSVYTNRNFPIFNSRILVSKQWNCQLFTYLVPSSFSFLQCTAIRKTEWELRQSFQLTNSNTSLHNKSIAVQMAYFSFKFCKLIKVDYHPSRKLFYCFVSSAVYVPSGYQAFSNSYNYIKF